MGSDTNERDTFNKTTQGKLEIVREIVFSISSQLHKFDILSLNIFNKYTDNCS